MAKLITLIKQYKVVASIIVFLCSFNSVAFGYVVNRAIRGENHRVKIEHLEKSVDSINRKVDNIILILLEDRK